MNIFKKISFRVIQKILHFSMYFLNFKEPELLSGINAIDSLVENLKLENIKNIFIVTDTNIVKLVFFEKIIANFREKDFIIEIFSDTLPNPSIQQIEIAYERYKNFDSDAIVAIGGGSSIDLAKGIGIRSTKPNKKLQELKGILKVMKKQPLLIAIPTTAGTGSEATVACVVTDEETNEKYAINDPVLIPKIAVLDPITCLDLPKHITATTGIDALTHAVEAYIGNSNTKKTKKMAKLAIEGIKDNLFTAYNNPKDIEARNNMLLASYRAGVAFTRAYVGNIHALAHQLGGMYQVSHGLANAVLMPYVLSYYGDNINKKLSDLYLIVNPDAIKVNKKENAISFIKWIKDLNQQMNIPEKLELDIDERSLKIMAKRAYNEANPLYPVPIIFKENDFIYLYKQAIVKK